VFGYNEEVGGPGWWTYRNANANKYEMSLWGWRFTFDEDGHVYDATTKLGRVGTIVF